jgi:hypothetical protein
MYEFILNIYIFLDKILDLVPYILRVKIEDIDCIQLND